MVLSCTLSVATALGVSAGCGWVVNATPRPLYPHEKDPLYPLYRGHAGPQGRSGMRHISAHSGFEHQTFQAALSYTGQRKKKQCVCVKSRVTICRKGSAVSREHMEGETRHVLSNRRLERGKFGQNGAILCRGKRRVGGGVSQLQ